MSIRRILSAIFGAGHRPSPAEAMRGLRMNVLTTGPDEFGITPSSEFPQVYGVLMDWPVAEHTATVMSLCDGNASLYTTSGFGVIGGVGHESVRTAAVQFVRTAGKHYQEAAVTQDYPLPEAGRVRFYLLCFDGVRVIEADLEALMSGKSGCAAMWGDGQRVLSELRLLAQAGQS